MVLKPNSPRRWLVGTVAVWLAGVGCLLNCLPMMQAATSTPAHHEALFTTVPATEETGDSADMPCHAPAKSEESAPADKLPALPGNSCCLADALPATFAKSFTPPALESIALPPAAALLVATDSFLTVSAFDLPPPDLGGTKTYLRIRVLRI